MGLNIDSLPVMNGLATISSLYGNARDIKITKEDNVFKIECFFYIYKDDIIVETMLVTKEYNEDFLTKTWNDVYTMVKEHLDTKGIIYTDAI